MSETCIIVKDGLKGFKEASENVYPKAMHITCTVHMIRNAAKYVLHSMKPDFLKDLKKYIWCKQLKRRKTQSFEYLKNKWGSSNKRAIKVIQRTMDNIKNSLFF